MQAYHYAFMKRQKNVNKKIKNKSVRTKQSDRKAKEQTKVIGC